MAETRVLVVDDEQSMRELLGIMLRQVGYAVTLADGGETAVEALKSDAFDLVITDLRMRKVDGLAVLRAAKEHSPRTVVLVVTAFASTETAVEAMKLGAYDYVTKPFNSTSCGSPSPTRSSASGCRRRIGSSNASCGASTGSTDSSGRVRASWKFSRRSARRPTAGRPS